MNKEHSKFGRIKNIVSRSIREASYVMGEDILDDSLNIISCASANKIITEFEETTKPEPTEIDRVKLRKVFVSSHCNSYKGYFHMWTNANAIIECSDGSIIIVAANQIRFVD